MTRAHALRAVFWTALMLGAAPLAAATTLPPEFQDAVSAYRAGNPGEAAALFRKLADQGLPEAEFNLALLYRQGEGLPQNKAEALYWAWKAWIGGASGGLARAEALVNDLDPDVTGDARAALADRLLADLTTARTDPAQAGRALLASAEVELHLVATPDLLQAYVWQTIAASMAIPVAVKARDATFAQMSADQQSGAEAAALAGFQDWCKALTGPLATCDAANDTVNADSAATPDAAQSPAPADALQSNAAPAPADQGATQVAQLATAQTASQ